MKRLFSQNSTTKRQQSLSSSPGGSAFLHGQLFIEVKRARNLPDMESWISKLVNSKDMTDAYVDVKLGSAKLVKTTVIDNSLDPVWNEEYRVEVCHFADELLFEVKDKDHAYSEYIGCVAVAASTLLGGPRIEDQWFPIRGGGHGGRKGELQLSIQFISVAMMERTYEVPCYFPMHRACNVTLYMDAKVPKGMPKFENLYTPEGLKYEPASCWDDVYKSLVGAEKMICITGWSVWEKLKLLRGEDEHIDGRTLSEILIDKANEGVQVNVLIWSEMSSGEYFGENGIPGLSMGTHDMETFNRFRNTRVRCALAPREISVHEFTDVMQNSFSSAAYTHHQKTIIVDAPGASGGPKRLVAYVGGLDLTDGRYDTPDFPLFSTLLREHRDDFHNGNAPTVTVDQGPREPWHDIHSRVEGTIAHDIYLNFFERWSKQGHKYGDLYPINISEIDYLAPAPIEDQARSWNVQLFRSITSDSAVFDPSKLNHMNSKKGRIVDASISQAYIQSIRNAENFVYIENQYFMGSAYSWESDVDTNCHHTIPVELTMKIVSKIQMKQRFTAYVVIPMFPEGDPQTAGMQEILYWQTRTMAMMYQKIGEALRDSGLSSHPTDWLLFMCPGKREEPGPHLDQLQVPSDPLAQTLRETLRFPIYVHSKMMIVDDAYIIVGSANINQRSMSGTRDTEIAVGCWQPSFPEHNPYGDVHMFRMALWTSHFCLNDPVFKFPGTVECATRVKELAYYNWQQYAGPQNSVTPGQMLPYPINVMPDGRLENLDGHNCFPDFPGQCQVMGKKSGFLPQKLTT